jgi:Fe-S-cluster containining protein
MVRFFSSNGADRDIKLLERIYHLVERAEKNLVADIGVPICIPNCGKCCEINSITVRGVEARYIALWLQKQKPELRKMVEEICVEWLKRRHENVGVYRGFGTARIEGESLDTLHNDVSQLLHKTPCPLLDENKQCLIHPARPLVCRTYGVSRVVPPDVCPRPLGRREEGIYRAFRKDADTEKAKELLSELRDINESRYMENSGFIAARILIELNPQRFLNLVYHNYVASAKLVQLRGKSLLWQEQVDEQIDRASEITLLCHPVPRVAEDAEQEVMA